jgi:hypothetical protein
VTDTHGSALLYGTLHRDVVVLRWPEDAEERARLNVTGVPHLLLVGPEGDAPTAETCIEDWLRLPANDGDAQARISALSRRGAQHPANPAIDGHGQLTYRAAVVFLSPVEHRLCSPLVERFGDAVADEELMERAWNGNGASSDRDRVLRVHVSRLRRRLEPLHLGVVRVPSYGYVMRESVSPDS